MKRIKVVQQFAGAAAVVCLLAGANTDAAASGVQIIGYLGNFDVYNHTGSEMEGFEVDIEGLDSSDLTSTYCFSAFGCGTGYNTTFGLGVVHDGNDPSAYRPAVAIGGVTHFGVHLRVAPPGRVNYNWLDRGDDGLLYYAGTTTLAAGQPAPPEPTPVQTPAEAAILTPAWTLDAANDRLVATITNDTSHPLWIQGVSAPDNELLTLDQLLATDPLFTSLVLAEPQLLDPGDTLSELEDILVSTVGGRAMFWVYAFTGPEELSDEELGLYNAACAGPCVFAETAGDLQSRVMTAANLAPIPLPPALVLLAGGVLPLVRLPRRKR